MTKKTLELQVPDLKSMTHEQKDALIINLIAMVNSLLKRVDEPGQSHEKLFTHNGLRMGVVNCCEDAFTPGFAKSREW
ncbi:hypothetical protein, partial [Paraburkholderia aspalathi]|uniref:hypothetical protein n=1 Tax=Paraburkholderia aspalathi TaxID=1324617 RepID=UPI001BAC2F75